MRRWSAFEKKGWLIEVKNERLVFKGIWANLPGGCETRNRLVNLCVVDRDVSLYDGGEPITVCRGVRRG